jgi:hypothetical protein
LKKTQRLGLKPPHAIGQTTDRSLNDPKLDVKFSAIRCDRILSLIYDQHNKRLNFEVEPFIMLMLLYVEQSWLSLASIFNHHDLNDLIDQTVW